MAKKAPLSLKGRALQLLALRDYSRLEMEQRLLRWLQAQDAKNRAQARSCSQAQGAAYADLQTAQTARGELAWAVEAEANAEANLEAEALSEDADSLLQKHRSAIADVLDGMELKGYLSDQRAAQALVQRRAGQLGAMRIRQELKTKGIAPEVAHELLASLQTSEAARAQAVWKKRFGQLPATLAERAKQTRYLASRGFGADAVRAVLRGMDVGDDCACEDEAGADWL